MSTCTPLLFRQVRCLTGHGDWVTFLPISAWGTLEIPKSQVRKPDERLPKAGISIVAGARWWIVQCTHQSSRIVRRLTLPLILIRAERLRTSDDGTCGADAKI